MSGTTVLPESATTGTTGFNWDLFLERAAKLGATTNQQRAALAGMSVRTYYRFRNGETDITVTKAGEIASNIGVSSARLTRQS